MTSSTDFFCGKTFTVTEPSGPGCTADDDDEEDEDDDEDDEDVADSTAG